MPFLSMRGSIGLVLTAEIRFQFITGHAINAGIESRPNHGNGHTKAPALPFAATGSDDTISVETLDLSLDFSEIFAQLNTLMDEHFS